MLEPRIVAARIQRPAAGEQGVGADRDRINASSQGRLGKADTAN
jgi:hypothetical protein